MPIRIEECSLGEFYDLALVVCGYEARSRFLVETTRISAGKKIAFAYGCHEVLSFEENRMMFEASGFNVKVVPEPDFAEVLGAVISDAKRMDSEPIRVLLDISCLTRARLAVLLEQLMLLDNLALDVFYSLAEFSAPSEEDPPYEYLRPVSERLSGWSGDASKAVVLVTGLGYEQKKALGIIEYLDSFENWLFFPESPIKKYDNEVRNANELLLRETPASNVLSYPVLDASVLVRKLFALVESLRRDYRCMIMPLGPKIFAFASFLAGMTYTDVSVWRASAGKFAIPVDKSSSKHSATFRVRWIRNGNNE